MSERLQLMSSGTICYFSKGFVFVLYSNFALVLPESFRSLKLANQLIGMVRFCQEQKFFLIITQSYTKRVFFPWCIIDSIPLYLYICFISSVLVAFFQNARDSFVLIHSKWYAYALSNHEEREKCMVNRLMQAYSQCGLTKVLYFFRYCLIYLDDRFLLHFCLILTHFTSVASALLSF